MFVARQFWAPKTAGYEHEYEDAVAYDSTTGVASIADGVSTAIFSRTWAELLTAGLVANPNFDPAQPESLTAWLAPHRKAWSQKIDLPRLQWNQVAKLNQCGGAWVTLLWLQITPLGSPTESEAASDQLPGEGTTVPAAPAIFEERRESSASNETDGPWRMDCHAVGDCNVFVIREGRLLLSHPMSSSADYAHKPRGICSMNRGHDSQLQAASLSADLFAGDELVLCTDAVGQWLWTELEQSSGSFDWNRLWNLSEADWQEELARQREVRSMPIDDCTLLLLRLQTTPACDSDRDSTTPGDDAIEEQNQVNESPITRPGSTIESRDRACTVGEDTDQQQTESPAAEEGDDPEFLLAETLTETPTANDDSPFIGSEDSDPLASEESPPDTTNE